MGTAVARVPAVRVKKGWGNRRRDRRIAGAAPEGCTYKTDTRSGEGRRFFNKCAARDQNLKIVCTPKNVALSAVYLL